LAVTTEKDIQTDFTVLENEDIILLRETLKNPYEIVEIPIEVV
jgi:hypothetical protein